MTADRRLDRRLLRGPVATIGVTWTDQNDAPTAPSGPPEVSVARMDGTVVHTGTAAAGTGVGRYTVTLPAAATATLDVLTATWTVDGVAKTTIHEVVGGFFFNLEEARTGPIGDAVKFSNERILLGRLEVEDECEFICGVAFVPRAARATLVAEGGYELRLPHPRVRTIRSVAFTPWDSTTATAWTLAQLAEVRLSADGRLTAPAGFATGDQVVVAYEHGYDRPPAPIAGAALRRLRSLLLEKKPDVYDFGRGPEAVADPTARAGPYRTGDDVVDAVYYRYSERQRGDQAAAVSRQLVYEPQRHSLFRRRGW